ncbi:MAG: hypothetical protein AB8G22_08500 [Saprospiraceae bacterium]
MKKSRLYRILLTFSSKEQRELIDLVASPFFNKRSQLPVLLEYLFHCINKNSTEPQRERAFSKMYPKEKFYDPKLRIARSDLLRLTEEYLVQKNRQADDVAWRIELAGAYRQRKLPKQFQRTLKQARQEQKKQPLRNDNYFNNNYEINLEELKFITLNKRVNTEILQDISDNIDFAFLTLKLRQTCFLLSHQNIQQAEYRFGLIEAITHYIQEQNFLEIPAIAVYYYTYFMLTQPQQEQHFQQLKLLLDQHSDRFPIYEIRDVYLMAINFCIKKINNGQVKYYDECLDLYEAALSKNYLSENGILSRFTFSNIVGLGIKRGTYQRVENFIQNYIEAVEIAYRENTLNFNLGRLEYAKKNYLRALQLLIMVDDKDPITVLIAKMIQLKIYYETDELDVLETHLDAMRTYIRRKQLAYQATHFLNVIKYVKKMLTLNPFDKKGRVQLAQAIENEEVVTERDWLLKQLREN